MVSIATLLKIYSAGKHLEQNIASHSYREVAPESCEIKPNLDCNQTFPIHLPPNEIPFGAKSVSNV